MEKMYARYMLYKVRFKTRAMKNEALLSYLSNGFLSLQDRDTKTATSVDYLKILTSQQGIASISVTIVN